jgi:hypothetical protein
VAVGHDHLRHGNGEPVTKITLQDGRLVLRDGKAATGEECCCPATPCEECECENGWPVSMYGFEDPDGNGVTLCEGDCNDAGTGPADCPGGGAATLHFFVSSSPGTAAFYQRTDWPACDEFGNRGVASEIIANLSLEQCLDGKLLFLVTYQAGPAGGLGCGAAWRVEAVLDSNGCPTQLKSYGDDELINPLDPCPEGYEIQTPAATFGPCRGNPLP